MESKTEAKKKRFHITELERAGRQTQASNQREHTAAQKTKSTLAYTIKGARPFVPF